MREDKKGLTEAMAAAEEAFEEKLEEHGLDAAFFDLEMTGYMLSQHSFTPLESVTFNPMFETESIGDEE